MNLHKFLVTLGRNVQATFANVNNGGCGVYATAVARALVQRGIASGICSMQPATSNAELISIDSARRHIEHLGGDVHNINHWERAGVDFYHIGVAFRLRDVWHAADTSAVERGDPVSHPLIFQHFAVYPDLLDLVEMEAMVRKPDGWNPAFDRANIKPMKKMIEQQFDHAFGRLTT